MPLKPRGDYDTWVIRAIEQALSGVQVRMQSGMAVLATIGSTAPRVGWSKTVWAIYAADDDQAEDGWLADINTTPLVDVMLVLIVILIITIPVPLHSVSLGMPSQTSSAVPEIVSVQMDAAGFVLCNDERITTMLTLKERIASVASSPVLAEIHLRLAFDTPYALRVRSGLYGHDAKGWAAKSGCGQLRPASF